MKKIICQKYENIINVNVVWMKINGKIGGCVVLSDVKFEKFKGMK